MKHIAIPTIPLWQQLFEKPHSDRPIIMGYLLINEPLGFYPQKAKSVYMRLHTQTQTNLLSEAIVLACHDFLFHKSPATKPLSAVLHRQSPLLAGINQNHLQAWLSPFLSKQNKSLNKPLTSWSNKNLSILSLLFCLHKGVGEPLDLKPPLILYPPATPYTGVLAKQISVWDNPYHNMTQTSQALFSYITPFKLANMVQGDYLCNPYEWTWLALITDCHPYYRLLLKDDTPSSNGLMGVWGLQSQLIGLDELQTKRLNLYIPRAGHNLSDGSSATEKKILLSLYLQANPQFELQERQGVDWLYPIEKSTTAGGQIDFF